MSKSYFNTNDRPEIVLQSKYFRDDNPIADEIKKAGLSIIPIINTLDDNPDMQQIIGTAFLIKYQNQMYVVTARHNLLETERVKSGDIEIRKDYILGFEGNDFNFYYYLTREILTEKGFAWVISKDEAIDIALAKVEISDELLRFLDIAPFSFSTGPDYILLKKDQPVYSFGYIHGWGQLAGRLIVLENGRVFSTTKYANLMSLHPHNLFGSILGFMSDEMDNIYVNLTSVKGVSGSPLFIQIDGKFHLIGINIKGKVIKLVDTLSPTKSIHDQYRYNGIGISLSAHRILDLIYSESCIKQKTTIISKDDLIINKRNLS